MSRDFVRRFVLSGAITGHEEEAHEYFADAEEAVRKRYPMSEIFNPMRLQHLGLTWEGYMSICRMRISGWATDIVYIVNEHYAASKGSTEERDRAHTASLHTHVFKNNIITDVPEEVACAGH